MRLFNKGDEISDQAKTAKLKREYKKMNELAQMIHWADVGREGSNYFEQLVEQKNLTESLKHTITGDISTEQAQKMIAKAVEVQRKADADRSAKSRSKAASTSKPRYAPRRQYGNRHDSGQNRDRRRNNHNGPTRNHRAGASKQSSRSSSGSGAPPADRG